jgi:hypothetical protein
MKPTLNSIMTFAVHWKRNFALFLAIMLVWPWASSAQEMPASPPVQATPAAIIEAKKPDPKAHMWVVGMGGVLMLGGSISWKFSKEWTGKYRLINEGFFQKWTYAGGADKLGHMYTDYVLVRILNQVYQSYDYSASDAVFYAWVNGSLIRTVMEFADGFTTFKASGGDLLFNMMGSTVSALLLKNPDWDETFNFSWSYLPSQDVRKGRLDASSFSIDYSGMVFTWDTNLKGARKLAGAHYASWMDRYQIGVNYRTRYFRDPDKSKRQRIVGMSLGLNLEENLPESLPGKRIFKYWKVPYTSVGPSYNIDSNRFQFDAGLNYFF